MSIFNRLFGRGEQVDFSEQISSRGVAWLLHHAEAVHTETIEFVEPGVTPSFATSMSIPNLLAEFDDSRLGIVFGRGRGHAFFRTSYLRAVISRRRANIEDARSLAEAFRMEGFLVKRVEYVSFD